MRILLTGACGVTPRAIARSLRASEQLGDVTIVGTDCGETSYGFYEAIYDRVYRVPRADDPAYVEVFEHICRTEAVDVAVVSPEIEVLFWSGREFPTPTLLPPLQTVRAAISKKSVYQALRDTELIPKYSLVTRADLLARRGLVLDDGSAWLRDYSDASSSGLGAIHVSDAEQAYAWALLNPTIADYMVAEFLPGRNLACTMLFYRDTLLKVGCYERLEYFMGRLTVSGVTGNISRGRLVNDRDLERVGEQAVRLISHQHNQPAHGLFTVDVREAADGTPRVTEINVRHTAGTSSLAAGGANMAEAQVLASLGRLDEIGDVTTAFPEDNLILRDIDGEPLLIGSDRTLEVGAFTEPMGARK